MAKSAIAAIIDAVRTPLTGQRGYRFRGEQENHQDQAQQTHTSIGLMAAAAQRTDDDSLRQALQTEHTLRSRLSVLEANKRDRGLTPEESWERASIIKGLEGLGTPAAVGDKPLAMFGTIGRPQGFLGPVAGLAPWLGMVRPWMLWTGALAASLAWGVTQSALKERVEDQRDAARAELAQAERSLVAARALATELGERFNEVNQDAAESAANLERERRITVAQRRRERELLRELQERVRDVGEPPAWSLRDGAGGDPAGAGDNPSGNPG